MSARALLRVPARGFPKPPTLWRFDAEQPLGEQFQSFSAASLARLSRVASPRAQGAYALRVDLLDGDVAYASTDFAGGPGTSNGPYGERAEIATGNPTSPQSRLFYAGDDVWIAWQIWVPAAFPDSQGSWVLVAQWKQLGGLGVPALALGLDRNYAPTGPDKWWLIAATNPNDDQSSTASVRVWNGPVTRDRWTRFSMRVRFSPDPAIGLVDLYGDLDGGGMQHLYGPAANFTMKNPDTSIGETVSRSHIRLGIYRDPAITGDAWLAYDGYTVASTRAAAESVAFTP